MILINIREPVNEKFEFIYVKIISKDIIELCQTSKDL
jgi:hypothetical protein